MESTEEKMVSKGSASIESCSRETGSNADKGKEPLGSKEVKRERGPQYPVRPSEPDCAFYMRTGYCRYGSTCRFNHPPRKPVKMGNPLRPGQVSEANPERVGKMECKFYLLPGGCRYGNACKFVHCPGKTDTGQTGPRVISFPLRPEEIECPMYMATGFCRSLDTCKFQHPPLLTSVARQGTPSQYFFEGSALSGYENGGPGYDATRALLLAETFGQPLPSLSDASSPFVPMFPHQFFYDNGYQDPPASASSSSSKLNVRYSHAPIMLKADESMNQKTKTEVHTKSPVQFNHPNGQPTGTPAVSVSPKGLPLRPDQSVCMYYSRYGLCKYGIGCQYDHPVNYGTTASQTLNQVPSPDETGKNRNQ